MYRYERKESWLVSNWKRIWLGQRDKEIVCWTLKINIVCVTHFEKTGGNDLAVYDYKKNERRIRRLCI